MYILGAVLAGLDQLTKYIAVSNLPLNERQTVIDGFFYLTSCRNTGGAWSFFSGRVTLLAIISLVAAILIVVLIYYCRNTLIAFSLGLVLAGAIGNMIDRFFHKYVVDFLDFIIFGYDFPVFNLADICVVCGGIGMIAAVLFSKHDARFIYRPSWLHLPGKKKQAPHD